ncbi:MAG: SH3 domain-containing protein [Treponema sp.]|nr:SH3 domain-containing protein [Treponema sp.]
MKKTILTIITVTLLFFFIAIFVYLNNFSRNGRDIEAIDYVYYLNEGGNFELPLSGATGFAAIELNAHSSANDFSSIIFTLAPGQGFTIIREENDWWNIESENTRGWVRHKYCLINLPDIIPSIVYNNTNTYSSLFRSSFYDIPNITGEALYEGRDFNERLQRNEYISPVMYPMSFRIFAAQQSALAEGNTLVIYEAFRPAEAHDFLHEHFSQLVEVNPTVRTGITSDSFNIRWFLAEAPYNHQRGTAIDTSLARIDNWETRNTGNYLYIHITEYTEYPMQTPMHEMSVASAIMSSNVFSRSPTAWIGSEINPIATFGTLLLLRYCSEAGLTPLSSEWWHFNDLYTTEDAIEMENEGRYKIERTHSRPPFSQ